MEIKISTNELNDIFKIPNKKIIDILKKYNITSFKKKFNYAFQYIWDLTNIPEECFNELNSSHLNSELSFEEVYSNYISEINRLKELELEKKRLKQEKKKQLLMESEMIVKTINEEINSMWFSNSNTEYVINVGPTNSGKTYKALESLMQSESGIYLSPLRLLAYEVYEKLTSNNITCDLFTGEDKIINNSNISSRTTEMMDFNKHYQTVILDECFLIGDESRGKSWLKTIVEAKCDKMFLITSEEGLFILEKILSTLNRKYTINRYERLTPIRFSNENYKMKSIKPKTVFVTFSRVDVLYRKAIFEAKGHNVSVLYGNLPPEIKKEQIKRFINGETDICVSTDVIGMGVNLPCNHVCFLTNTKFDGKTNRELTATEIKQIGGRAGRYGMSDEGVVWVHNFSNNNFKHKFNSEAEIIKNAYLPVNISIVSKLPYETFFQKLTVYSKLDVIPNGLKDIIKLEKIDRYLELIRTENKLEKIDIDLAWKLINLPITDSNMYYWRTIVTTVLNKTKLIFNVHKTYKPNDSYQLKSIEDELKNIDLFINFSNYNEFKELVDEINIEQVKEYKNKLINIITEFLLNKKMSSKKLCTSCGKNVGINWPHKECDNCHRQRYSFYDDDDWF